MRTGTVPNKAVIYTRVSSSEQLREGFSIAAQEIAAREYARRHGFEVVAEFSDDETAKTTGRSDFSRMLDHLRKHPDHDLIVEKVDRLYRNVRDYLTLDELGVPLHFVKEGGAHQRNADARFMHLIRVGMARKYVENLSEEVKKGMRQKAAEGGFPTWAPLGYVNVKDPIEKKAVGGIAPDAAKAPLVLELFEAAATGRHSLGALVRLADEIGLRGRYGHRLGKSVIVKVLTNVAYTGMFRWSGVVYRGRYAPLITAELYDRVQAVLATGSRAKSGLKHEFPFGGLARCGGCGGLLSGDRKKGRYVYYSCACSRARGVFYAERVLDEAFASVLRRLILPAEVRASVLAELDRWYSEASKKENTKVTRARSRLAELQTLSASAYEEKLLGRISEAMWSDLSDRWKAESAKLRETIATAAAPVERARFMAAASAPFELAQTTAVQYLQQNDHEKGRMVKTCVSNCIITDGNVSIHLRSPLDVIEKMAGCPDWLAIVDEFRTALLVGMVA